MARQLGRLGLEELSCSLSEGELGEIGLGRVHVTPLRPPCPRTPLVVISSNASSTTALGCLVLPHAGSHNRAGDAAVLRPDLGIEQTSNERGPMGERSNGNKNV
jgi:hypothetical protein